MRKTKIVCTLGTACSNEKTLTEMCRAGMNVARLNFSHGTHEQQLERIELIKKVRSKLGVPLAILLDTKGPEYRIGTFENGSVELQDNDEFTLTTEDIIGDEKRVSVSYKALPQELKAGDTILLNDGMLTFKVKSVTDKDILCHVEIGGTLSDRKSMSFPNKVLKQAYLSEQDKSERLTI